jgi:uncharacterized integral membrane protein
MTFYEMLPLIILFLIFVVGGYVYMFLHIMRSDPREIEFRKEKNINNDLIPTKKS